MIDDEHCKVCGQPDNCGDCDHTPAIDRVFVYGTLNPDSPNYNHWMVERIFLGEPTWYRAETPGTRMSSRLPWDYVWFHEDGEYVAGAVLVMDDPVRQLRELDGYEGYHPNRGDRNNFVRKEITLTDGNKAWGYEWNVFDREEALKQEVAV